MDFPYVKWIVLLLCHTKSWLARDIISYNGTMFSRVLAYTLLHHDLRDYSLG